MLQLALFIAVACVSLQVSLLLSSYGSVDINRIAGNKAIVAVGNYSWYVCFLISDLQTAGIVSSNDYAHSASRTSDRPRLTILNQPNMAVSLSTFH